MNTGNYIQQVILQDRRALKVFHAQFSECQTKTRNVSDKRGQGKTVVLTRIRTTSAASMATSVPVPIAIPTSALASAGESLTPSPTIATFLLPFWSSWTFATLWEGRTSAKTFLIPTYIQRNKHTQLVIGFMLRERTICCSGWRGNKGRSYKLILVEATRANYTKSWRVTCLWHKKGADYSLLSLYCRNVGKPSSAFSILPAGFWSSTALAIKVWWIKDPVFS